MCAMFFLGRRGALFVRIACLVFIPLCTFAGLVLYVIGVRCGHSILIFVSVLLCVHWPFLIDHVGDKFLIDHVGDNDAAGRSLSLPVQVLQQPASPGTEQGPSHAEPPAQPRGVHRNGLGASAIEALPAYEYDKKAGGDECAVCLGELQRGEVVKRLPACKHVFHQGCIDAWLRSRVTSPVCRSLVSNAAQLVGAPIMVRVE